MSPKLVIQAMAVLLMAVPAVWAEESAPAAAEQMPAAASPLVEASTPVPVEEPTGTGSAQLAPEIQGASDGTTAALDDGALVPTADATPADAPTASLQAELAVQPELEMTAEEVGEAPPAAPAPETEPSLSEPVLDTHPPLGAIGYDSNGRRGRVHIVVSRDTLWDISDAYLGTPWVWPSIWRDNGEIVNPHLIHPGDRIWITPSEMRRISAEEAALLLSNLPSEPEALPASAEDFSIDTPETRELPALVTEPVERGSMLISSIENAGLITLEQLEAASSIVGRVPERVFLSQEDDVFIGLGESDVEAGDQLTIFRTHEKVFDPDTRVLLGYHVEFLGWLEVQETSPETSRATIHMSTGEIQEGDLLIPREPLSQRVAIQESPEVDGKISFFPQKRVVIGFNDFVFLNRGSVDGLEVGSPLDVFRPGYPAEDEARRDRVLVPDFVIGRLLVVRTEAESAVAMVMGAKTELALGDRFRGAGR